jgi:hypothetical protein
VISFMNRISTDLNLGKYFRNNDVLSFASFSF